MKRVQIAMRRNIAMGEREWKSGDAFGVVELPAGVPFAQWLGAMQREFAGPDLTKRAEEPAAADPVDSDPPAGDDQSNQGGDAPAAPEAKQNAKPKDK